MQKREEVETIDLSLDQINGARNIVHGLLTVLNSSYTPGYLSAELHNGRAYCETLINNMETQINSLKNLAKKKTVTKRKRKKRADEKTKRLRAV